MLATKKQNAEQTTLPHIGDRVAFRWGLETLEGIIVEDRGNLGVGGARMFRIEAELEPAHKITLELPTYEFKLKAA